jgi:branched-chain amino acid transport system ATP-binding protein
VSEILEWLDLARVAELTASSLPYGAQKTLGMAISLMAWPRLLMLDEPVAGLSAAEADHVRDTIRKVRDRGISLVVIDHNMRFMANLCERILVVHHGQELAHGTPQEVLTHPAVIEAYLGRKYVRA